MTTVIDVGCARYGADYSIERLIDEFHPDFLYGFDPAEKPQRGSRPGATLPTRRDEVDGCKVLTYSEAAWTHQGDIGFQANGLRSSLTDDPKAPRVPCFDLAAHLRGLAQTHDPPLILKIDAERAEYVLLDHLIDRGVDKHLALVWVEWHPLPDLTHQVRRESIEGRIACEVREWTF